MINNNSESPYISEDGLERRNRREQQNRDDGDSYYSSEEDEQSLHTGKRLGRYHSRRKRDEYSDDEDDRSTGNYSRTSSMSGRNSLTSLAEMENDLRLRHETNKRRSKEKKEREIERQRLDRDMYWNGRDQEVVNKHADRCQQIEKDYEQDMDYFGGADKNVDRRSERERKREGQGKGAIEQIDVDISDNSSFSGDELDGGYNHLKKLGSRGGNIADEVVINNGKKKAATTKSKSSSKSTSDTAAKKKSQSTTTTTAAATKKKKSTATKKTSKKQTGLPQIGAKPAKPFVPPLSAAPNKKLLKGKVSTNVAKANLPNALSKANERIVDLELQLTLYRGELENVHAILSNSAEAHEYIDLQDTAIAHYKSESERLDKELNATQTKLTKSSVECTAAKRELATVKKSNAELESRLKKAEKNANALSKDDLIDIENNKTENAMRLAEHKEHAKLDCHIDKQEYMADKQEEKFQRGRKGFSRHQRNRGAWNGMNEEFDVSLCIYSLVYVLWCCVLCKSYLTPSDYSTMISDYRLLNTPIGEEFPSLIKFPSSFKFPSFKFTEWP